MRLQSTVLGKVLSLARSRLGQTDVWADRNKMKLNFLVHIPVSNSWKSLNCNSMVEGTEMTLQPFIPQLLFLVLKAVGKWKITDNGK